MTDDTHARSKHAHPTWKDPLFLFAVMGAILSGLDSYLSEQRGQNIGLCAGFGFGTGLCFGLAYLVISNLLRRLPYRLSQVVILVSALGIGHFVVQSLHGYTRMSSYPSVGLLTIVLSYGLPAFIWLMGRVYLSWPAGIGVGAFSVAWVWQPSVCGSWRAWPTPICIRVGPI